MNKKVRSRKLCTAAPNVSALVTLLAFRPHGRSPAGDVRLRPNAQKYPILTRRSPGFETPAVVRNLLAFLQQFQVLVCLRPAQIIWPPGRSPEPQETTESMRIVFLYIGPERHGRPVRDLKRSLLVRYSPTIVLEGRPSFYLRTTTTPAL